jgi:hypothetical protein
VVVLSGDLSNSFEKSSKKPNYQEKREKRKDWSSQSRVQ